MTWEWLTLKDILVPQSNKKPVQQGWSPRCRPEPANGGEWGVLKTTAIQPGHFEPTHNKALPASLDPRPNIEVKAGDLLITCAGPRSRCGVPALVRHAPRRLMMSGKMYRFRPDDRLLPRFLELWLLSAEAQRQIDSMKTGISDSGLNLTHGRFVQLPVPVPSLVEQRRIVEALEAHLSRLDAADASLATATNRLHALRNTQLTVIFGRREIPLADLIVGISAGKSFGSASGPAGADEWGIVKVSAMTAGVFDETENKAVAADRVDPRFEIQKGDLLVSRANTSAYVGASVLVGDVRPKLLLSDKSLRITPKPGVDREWLWRALQAPSARQQMSRLATGTKDSMRNISQGALGSIALPRATPDEQADALDRFSTFLARTLSAGDSVRLAQDRAKALRRSLFRAAFAGELVDHDHADELIAETLAGSR